MQKPTIGRVVHYTNLGDKDGRYPPEVQAAIVTGVYIETEYVSEDGKQGGFGCSPANQVGAVPNSMRADLRILYRTGEFNMTSVPYSEIPERGHWNWPPKV